MQKLARYWATDYNWRKVEERLNSLPQFMTTIDGLDIHFIHVSHATQCVANYHYAWMARLHHGDAEGYRSADESNGTWRDRRRRISTW
jgi:hypothetical protein